MLSPDDNMLAVGSCLAGFGILMTGLLALLFRRPDAPRWTRPELVAMLVCVPVTGMIGLGLGFTAYGLFRLVEGTGDPGELLVLAGVLVVLALAWRALAIRRRLAPMFGPSRETGDATTRRSSPQRDESLVLPAARSLPAPAATSLDPGMATPRLISLI